MMDLDPGALAVTAEPGLSQYSADLLVGRVPGSDLYG
jgi:hypothetical protein